MKTTALIFALLLTLAACQPAAVMETPTVQPAAETAAPTLAAPTLTPPTAAAPTQTAPTQTAPSPDLPTAAPPIEATATMEKPAMPQSPEAASAYPPVPADKAMGRGKFFIDSFELVLDPGKPGYFVLTGEGNLPTPCHQPRVSVRPPDQNNQIMVEVYSVVAKDQMCTQVLKPFTGKLAELGGYPSGKYTVKVNDLPAREISVP